MEADELEEICMCGSQNKIYYARFYSLPTVCVSILFSMFRIEILNVIIKLFSDKNSARHSKG